MKNSELFWAICEIDDDLIRMAKEDCDMKRHGNRWLRISLCAAAIVVLFVVSGFAAYEYNWFGFRDVFGLESNLIEDHVQVLNPEAENVNTDIVAEEHVYTNMEQYLIEEEGAIPPEQAEITGTGVQAITEDYLYTLEELIVSEDSLFAILKVEAQNEGAIPRMEMQMEKGADEFFAVYATNQSGETNRDFELKNGGINCGLMQLKDGVGYYLISNTGGEFAVGDRILFKDSWEAFNLFEITLTQVMDATVSIDVENKDFSNISLTPLTLTLNDYSGRLNFLQFEITLRDGTVIALPSRENEYACTEYGSYGALSYASSVNPDTGYGIYTCSFSRLIDPEQVLKVTINGTDYNVN